MKRLFLALAIMAIGTLSGFAQNILELQEYNFGKITRIEAGSIFEIKVVQGDSKTVKVYYDKQFRDFLQVNYALGQLDLSLSKDWSNRFKGKKNGGIKVYLQMPYIEKIELHGASNLTAEGTFKTNEMEIDLSGASSVDGLRAKGDKLDIECSGASKLHIDAEFKHVEAELHGAAKVTYTGDSQKLDGEFSGAVSANFYGNHTITNIECSGASNIGMEGETEYLTAEISGASKFKGEKYQAKDAHIEATGASNAQVRCTGDLKIMVGRASKLTYYGNPNVINLDTESNIKKGD